MKSLFFQGGGDEGGDLSQLTGSNIALHMQHCHATALRRIYALVAVVVQGHAV